jgi:hypothetical protein
MSAVDVLLFIVIAVAGLAAFCWANRFGKKQKARFESEARDRILQSLSKLGGNERHYKFYALIEKEWSQTDIAIMKNQVVDDCTRRSPDGASYGKARFSLFTDSSSRSVYYVIGTNSFKFSELPCVPS